MIELECVIRLLCAMNIFKEVSEEKHVATALAQILVDNFPFIDAFIHVFVTHLLAGF